MIVIDFIKLQKELEEEEFLKIKEEYKNKRDSAKNLRVLAQKQDDKIIITNIFEFEEEYYKTINWTREKDGFVWYFAKVLEMLTVRGKNVKCALLNPNNTKDFFEIEVENEYIC